jgi:O-antigen/teichoic acid export membrane protein
MKTVFNRITGSRDIRDLGVVMTENILIKLINFTLIIILARTLGPEQYGVYSMITVAILFLVPFIDFGMENTAVRFSGKYPNLKNSIFGLYALLKILVIVLLGGVMMLWPSLMGRLLQKPEISRYLLIILAGVCGEALLFVLTTYWQAAESFLLRAVVHAGVYFFRFILLVSIIFITGENIPALVWAFALASAPFILPFTGKFVVFIKKLLNKPPPATVLREMASYEKWMFIGSISINLMTRLDFFVVTYFLSFKEMGLYNSAFQLTAILSVIPFVFGKVFLPKVSKFTKTAEINRYLKKAGLFGLLITAVAGGIGLISQPLILLSFGREFSESIAIFRILLVAFVFSSWIDILGLVFYALEKPKILVIGKYLQLAAFIISAIFLMPYFGATGAAISRAVASVLCLVFSTALLFKWITTQNGNNNCNFTGIKDA